MLIDAGAPHASFDIYPEESKDLLRESLEVRILVMWDRN